MCHKSWFSVVILPDAVYPDRLELPHSNNSLIYDFLHWQAEESWPKFSLAPPRSRKENSHEAHKPVAKTQDDDSGYFRLNWSRCVFDTKSERGRRNRHGPGCKR